MLLRAFLTLSLAGGISWAASAGALAYDSLPPMHTLKAEDIDSAKGDFFSDTVTVFLKDGRTLAYGPEDWDIERYEPSLDKRLLVQIRHATKQFGNLEHEPEFIGGEEAWNKYIADFCDLHKEAIRKEGTSQITLTFMVHLKGQLTHVGVISNPDHSKLGPALVQYFQEGTHWMPGILDHGYKVVADRTVKIKLVKPRK